MDTLLISIICITVVLCFNMLTTQGIHIHKYTYYKEETDITEIPSTIGSVDKEEPEADKDEVELDLSNMLGEVNAIFNGSDRE